VTAGAPAVGDLAFASLLEAAVLPFGGLHLSTAGKRKHARAHLSEVSVFFFKAFGRVTTSRKTAHAGPLRPSTGDLTPAIGSALGCVLSGANVELPFHPLGAATAASPHLHVSVGSVAYSFEGPPNELK
jgi:hypothetical protein